MNITPEIREQIRLSLLRYGLNHFTIGLARQYLASEGMRGLSREEVQAEINYLADPQKALLRENPKAVSPEMRTYATTAAGRDYLAEAGLD
jgi:hypothetical protein